MPRQRSRFGGNPFHQIAVTANDPGAVSEKLGINLLRQKLAPHGHAYCHRNPLAQGPGGGFYAGRMAELRMTGGSAARLAEIADFIKAEIITR